MRILVTGARGTVARGWWTPLRGPAFATNVTATFNVAEAEIEASGAAAVGQHFPGLQAGRVLGKERQPVP